MPSLVLYTKKGGCPLCSTAKQIIEKKGLILTIKDVEDDYDDLRGLGRLSAPVLLIEGECVSGQKAVQKLMTIKTPS